MLTILDITIWASQNPNVFLIYCGYGHGFTKCWNIELHTLDNFTLKDKTPLREVIESYKQEQTS
jgi:hypothetical protein